MHNQGQSGALVILLTPDRSAECVMLKIGPEHWLLAGWLEITSGADFQPAARHLLIWQLVEELELVSGAAYDAVVSRRKRG
jgi:hypothetical protein